MDCRNCGRVHQEDRYSCEGCSRTLLVWPPQGLVCPSCNVPVAASGRWLQSVGAWAFGSGCGAGALGGSPGGTDRPVPHWGTQEPKGGTIQVEIDGDLVAFTWFLKPHASDQTDEHVLLRNEALAEEEYDRLDNPWQRAVAGEAVDSYLAAISAARRLGRTDETFRLTARMEQVRDYIRRRSRSG